MRSEAEIRRALERCSIQREATDTKIEGLLDAYLNHHIKQAIRHTLSWVLEPTKFVIPEFQLASSRDLVLEYLTQLANKNQSSYVRIYKSDIAAACGISIPTVHTAIKKLCEEGVVIDQSRGSITLKHEICNQSQDEVRV